MIIDKINREVTVELSLEKGDRKLLRKAAGSDYIDAPFSRFKPEYSPSDLVAMATCLREANRIGHFKGDERVPAGDLALELETLAAELEYPTRF